MGGSIEVTSALERGSTFTLVVPLARPDPQDPAPARPAATPPSAPLPGGLVVLVAEGDLANLTVVTAMLETLCMTPVAAATGEQALALLESRRFDAALMDAHLPGLDGLEVTRRWRQRETERPAVRLPIVAVTDDATEVGAGQCMAAGMDFVLVKPFGLADLRAHLVAATQAC